MTRKRGEGRKPTGWWPIVAVLVLLGCEPGATPASAVQSSPAEALPDSVFVSLVERISEPGGYFDTDNLLSNEAGYLKVMDALEASGLQGGAYVGVGPDQNFSYIAVLRPEIAFITDIRRDNLLHHLLLKALMERSETRVEFLAALHGRPAPPDPGTWTDRDAAALVAYVEDATHDSAFAADLQDEVVEAVRALEMGLSDADLETVRRFHRAFIEAGPGLRFTTFGRPPRPHYPTYGQLVLETDRGGRSASYLSDALRYRVVREMQLANRIVPVVGDMAGDHALREMGEVMREMGVGLTAFYASNVEFYLWSGGTFPRWEANLAALPASEGAVIIRSYFPNFGRRHPSAVPGYFATQTLQPVAELLRGGFGSYWEVVTRGVVGLD